MHPYRVFYEWSDYDTWHAGGSVVVWADNEDEARDLAYVWSDERIAKIVRQDV